MNKKVAPRRQLCNDCAALQAQLAETQVALKELETKFDVIFDEALDVILVIDGITGQIIDANQTIERILGYPNEALIGQHFSTLFSAAGGPSAGEGWEGIRIHDIAFEGLDFQHADGSALPMDLTVNIIAVDQGPHLLVTLRNVTERRQAEYTQEKLIQELDAFAHTVAHDLRAPLGVMTGAAEVLQQLVPVENEQLQQVAGLLLRNSLKMNGIIEALLLLAQVRHKELEVQSLDMATIVIESQQRLANMIQRKQAEIRLPATWPVAVGYGPWVEEVWVNYLSNALKYGGQPPLLELGADVQPKGMVRFWVRDNGPGLTKEEQAQLFAPYTQLDRLRGQGHGLGLSIVRRIVDRLGGKVGVESDLGLGSLFSFTLPAAAED